MIRFEIAAVYISIGFRTITPNPPILRSSNFQYDFDKQTKVRAKISPHFKRPFQNALSTSADFLRFQTIMAGLFLEII